MITIASLFPNGLGLELVPHYVFSKKLLRKGEFYLNNFLETTTFPYFIIEQLLQEQKSHYLIHYHLTRNKHLPLTRRIEHGKKLIEKFVNSDDFDGEVIATDLSIFFSMFTCSSILLSLPIEILQQKEIIECMVRYLPTAHPRTVFSIIYELTVENSDFGVIINSTDDFPFSSFGEQIRLFRNILSFENMANSLSPIDVSLSEGQRYIILTKIIERTSTLTSTSIKDIIFDAISIYNKCSYLRYNKNWIRALVLKEDFSSEFLYNLYATIGGTCFYFELIINVMLYKNHLNGEYLRETMTQSLANYLLHLDVDDKNSFFKIRKILEIYDFTLESFEKDSDIKICNIILPTRHKLLSMLNFTSEPDVILQKWFPDPRAMRVAYTHFLKNPSFPNKELVKCLDSYFANPSVDMEGNIKNIIMFHYSNDALLEPYLDKFPGIWLRLLIDQDISDNLCVKILRKGEFPSQRALKQNSHLSLSTFKRGCPQILEDQERKVELLYNSSSEKFLSTQVEIETLHHKLYWCYEIFSRLDKDIERQVCEIVLCEDRLYWHRRA